MVKTHDCKQPFERDQVKYTALLHGNVNFRAIIELLLLEHTSYRVKMQTYFCGLERRKNLFFSNT